DDLDCVLVVRVTRFGDEGNDEGIVDELFVELGGTTEHLVDGRDTGEFSGNLGAGISVVLGEVVRGSAEDSCFEVAGCFGLSFCGLTLLSMSCFALASFDLSFLMFALYAGMGFLLDREALSRRVFVFPSQLIGFGIFCQF